MIPSARSCDLPTLQLCILLGLARRVLVLLRSNASGLHLLLLIARSAHFEVGSRPDALERHTRMRYGQCDASYDNHRSLKNHVRDLLIGELSCEALGQLGDTEAATNKDGDGGNNESWTCSVSF